MAGGTEPVEHVETTQGGAFFVEREGRRIGELKYRPLGPKLVDVLHTEVAVEARGQGLADRLLDAAVAWARSTGTRIQSPATCPFARARFAANASIRDVLAETP